jgi:hypothetical protein
MQIKTTMNKYRSFNMYRGLVILTLLFHAQYLFAESIASYPQDWRSWPVVKVSMVPAADVVLPPETPLFIQETVKAYNWINEGKGTKLTIRVHPDKLEQFKNHGPYSDGPTAVGVYDNPDVVFVTEHLAGGAIYGTYDSHGNDISSRHESFAPHYCVRCHDAYKDICINGTCATPVIDLFAETTSVEPATR